MTASGFTYSELPVQPVIELDVSAVWSVVASPRTVRKRRAWGDKTRRAPAARPVAHPGFQPCS